MHRILKKNSMKNLIGGISAFLAIILSIVIFLGLLNIIPLISYHIFGETLLRFLTAVTVFFFLIAAWAFWQI
jgi:CBS domain containing-hemolysin-like protein